MENYSNPRRYSAYLSTDLDRLTSVLMNKTDVLKRRMDEVKVELFNPLLTEDERHKMANHGIVICNLYLQKCGYKVVSEKKCNKCGCNMQIYHNQNLTTGLWYPILKCVKCENMRRKKTRYGYKKKNTRN